MGRKYWTDIEIKKLEELYPKTTAADLADIFNCSLSRVYNKSYSLGLKKDKTFIAEIARQRTSELTHPGRKYRFKKGHTPMNAGKRQTDYMSDEAFERSKATRFRKGNVPANSLPIGSERFDRDGYLMIKIEPSIWELKHRHIWKQANGNIPKGYNVQFRDGNRLNVSIDNLYLISRKDQISQNSIVRYPSEVRTAMKRVNKINKLIKLIKQ